MVRRSVTTSAGHLRSEPFAEALDLTAQRHHRAGASPGGCQALCRSGKPDPLSDYPGRLECLRAYLEWLTVRPRDQYDPQYYEDYDQQDVVRDITELGRITAKATVTLESVVRLRF